MRHSLLTLVLAALCGACAPATVQLARTNGQGNIQVVLEPGVLGAVVFDEGGFGPSFNVSARYGVTDRFDLGGRLGTGLYEIQGKVLLTDPAAKDSLATSVAFATTVFGGGLDEVGALYWTTRLPVLVGLPIGPHELTLGPSLSTTLIGGAAADEGSAGVFGLGVGGQVGFALKVANQLRVVPQLDVTLPVFGAVAAMGEGESTSDLSGTMFGAQLGLMFGGP